MRKLYTLVAGLFIVLVATKTNGQLNPQNSFSETSNIAVTTVALNDEIASNAAVILLTKHARQILKLAVKLFTTYKKIYGRYHGIANRRDRFISAGNLAMAKTLVFNTQIQIPVLIQLFIITSNREFMKFV